MLTIDRFFPLSLLVVALIGCQDSLGGPQADKPVRPVPATQPAATQPAATEPAAPRTVVKVLNPGQEPRRPLRLSVKKGQKQRALVTSRYTNEPQAGAKMIALQREPALTITMETEVTGVSETGDISYRFGFVAADALEERDIESNVVESRRMIAQQLVGAAGTIVVSDRGEAKSAQVASMPNLIPDYRDHAASRLQQVRTALAQTWPRFPEEPLGVGAKWQVTTTSTANPYLARLTQTITYEVIAIDGDRVKLQLGINESGSHQPVQRQGQTDSTVKMTIVESKGTGSGVMTLDLTTLLPQMGSLTMTSSYDLEYVTDTSPQNYMQSKLKTQNLLETLH